MSAWPLTGTELMVIFFRVQLLDVLKFLLHDVPRASAGAGTELKLLLGLELGPGWG